MLEKIPTSLQIGFYNVSLESVKNKLLERCKKSILKLKETILRNFKNWVKKTEEIVIDINKKLIIKKNANISKFLIMKEFIKGGKLEKKIENISLNLDKLNILNIYIEEFWLEYDKKIYETYFIGNLNWINDIYKRREDASNNLVEMRFLIFLSHYFFHLFFIL